jgi:hypothetical protein
VVSIRRSKIIGEEETNKAPSRGKKKKDILKERFIKNKRPMNPTHIFLKKEK